MFFQDMVKKNTKKLNPEKKDAKPTPFESMLYTNLSGVIVVAHDVVYSSFDSVVSSLCISEAHT